MMKIETVKYQILFKSTQSNSPTPDSGATSLPLIGNASMYMETSSINNGENAFVSSERTDIIQDSIITFFNNGFDLRILIYELWVGLEYKHY